MFIEPQAYWHDDYLEKEYDKIFSNGFFVADAGTLRNEGDYTSYRLCGRPLVTRNMAAQISTFENVCLHRANLIDPLGRGNRPFRCGYHGWQYDGGGQLERTPLAADHCISRRQLQSYQTVEKHGLVFASTHGSLPAEFGDAVLNQIGLNIGNVFHRDTLGHDANWKLLVENVLESYHLSFVHQTSFVPTGITSTSQSSSEYFNADSSFSIASKDAGGSKGRVIPGANSDYVHAFVFPNLFISITGGLIGFVSHFKPNLAAHTELEWQLFETPLLMSQKDVVRNFIKKNAVEFTNKVLNEDLAVLNNSQMGIRHARSGHQIQEIEGRIAQFHKTYLEMMA